MKPIDIVKTVVYKSITKKVDRKRRGPKGYGLLRIKKLLLYSVLNEIFSTGKMGKQRKKRKKVWKGLGFKKMPSKRSIDEWKKKYEQELSQVIRLVGNKYLQLNESEWTILDSTPIPDYDDEEALTGHSSMGEFIGFKLHVSCDEFCVPLRAEFSDANVHDSKKAFVLLSPTLRVGGDPAYDFKELKKAVKEQGSKGYFVHNPRREGKEAKKPTPKILKKARICVEQCNSVLKLEVMREYWTKIKGYAKKAVFALTAVLALQAVAISNLIEWGYPSIRISEVRA